MSLRLKALSSVRWVASATGSNVAGRFLVTLAAAHTLPVADLGLYAIVNLVLGFAYLFADAGLTQSIVSRQDADGDQLSSLYWCNLLFGAIVCVAVCLAAPAAAGFYQQPRLLGMLALTSAAFAINPFGQVSRALLQKHLRFDAIGRAEILANLASTVFAVALLYGGGGVYALIWSQLLATAVRSASLGISGRGLLRARFRLRFGEIRFFLQFGLFQMADRVVNYLYMRLDQFLIASLLGPQALGFYAMAWTLIVEPVYRINPIITSVAFPIFARQQHDRRVLRRGYLLVVRLLATINAPLLLGFAAIAPTAIPFILGERWAPAVPLVEILSVVALVRTVVNPVGSLVLAVGRADLSFYASLTQFLVQVPIYAGFLAWGGLVPATLFLCAANIAAVPIFFLYLMRRTIELRFADYLGAFLPSIALAAVMALAVRLLSVTALGSQVALLAAQLLLGALLYGGLVLLFRRDDAGEFARLVLRRP